MTHPSINLPVPAVAGSRFRSGAPVEESAQHRPAPFTGLLRTALIVGGCEDETAPQRIWGTVYASVGADMCSDCPPIGYPHDRTRCGDCPRRSHQDRELHCSTATPTGLVSRGKLRAPNTVALRPTPGSRNTSTGTFQRQPTTKGELHA